MLFNHIYRSYCLYGTKYQPFISHLEFFKPLTVHHSGSSKSMSELQESVKKILYTRFPGSPRFCPYSAGLYSVSQPVFEPQHDKTNLCAQSDQSLRCLHEETLSTKLSIERKAKTLIRLHRWLCRLIWFFTGRTYHFVGFVVLRLISALLL